MRHSFIYLGIALLFFNCKNVVNQKPKIAVSAPVAEKKAKKLEIHGDIRIDNYFWMRLSDEQKNAENPDEQTQKVVDYLNAETNYRKKVMKETESFQEKLFDEMKSRIKEDDASVPVKSNGYEYYVRTEKGAEYALYCRKRVAVDAEEEIMLNGPNLAKGHEYFAIAGRSVSPDNTLLAYGSDAVSRRLYTIRFKNLQTGELLSDELKGTNGSATWANDNKTIFYTKKDPQTLRSSMIYKHKLGTAQSEDVLVFEEKDATFGASVYKTKSKEFIIIVSYSTVSNEYRFVNSSTPDENFRIIQPRIRGIEYSVSHYGDFFYILTNHEAKNFRLMKTPINATQIKNWQEVIPHREDVFLEGIELFENYLVLDERKNGLSQIRVTSWDKKKDNYLQFNDPAYSVRLKSNLDFDTNFLRYTYTSLTTPSGTYEYNMSAKSQILLKQREVVGGHNPLDYESKRLYATARDGKKVPMSLVYKKGIELDGNNPTLLYAYGSYGYTIDPGFSSLRLSLLDRGFVFAIAHIRGGQVNGREWYEDGKLLNKKNTFTDYIDCAKFLIGEKYTNPKKLYSQGGSAGGLLMGAVVNMNPELFNGVIAAVPFVDVISTMLDESIPLTTGEFDEWGNPKDKKYYDYIKTYSPYDNVEAKAYPNMLVTTGYWDSQVQYWEPAKWVAKLRELKTDDAILLMDVNMETGHGGASGRFAALKEYAMEYAFFFMLEGIKE